MLSKKIDALIAGKAYIENTVGLSGSKVLSFEDMVLKIQDYGIEAENEFQMLSWLQGRLPVPKVLCREVEKGKSRLLMSRLTGQMCCAPELMADPNTLVEILAMGLNMLWTVDITQCPVDMSLDNKLAMAEKAVKLGLCHISDAEPETYGENGFASPEELLLWLKEHRPDESPVLSHGDYCLPNVFVQNGAVSGFLDMGRCGIADRYQDIALCWRSLKHNYSGAYGGMVYEDFNPDSLFDALKITPDLNKIKYYILLDELF